jgi:hypothetical protein
VPLGVPDGVADREFDAVGNPDRKRHPHRPVIPN